MLEACSPAVLWCIVGASVAGCSAQPDEPDESVASASSPIISGKTSPEAQDSVVLLVHTDNRTVFSQCTGTLVAPNLVLTARHCVSETTTAPFYCSSSGQVVSGEAGGGKVQDDFEPAEIYVFVGSTRPDFGAGGRIQADAQGKEIFHDESETVCGHDLGLLVLDRAVPNIPLASIRLDGDTRAGETITAVGWGVTTSSNSPRVRQQRTGIVIQAVGPFDGPNGEWATPANDFAVGESICAGDSGGPGFSEQTGAVVGVVSRGGNGVVSPDEASESCVGDETINTYTRPSAFKSVILSAFAAAGASPVLEGSSDPARAAFGTACTQNDECQSGVCDEGLCNQACEATSCPNGYECRSPDGDPSGAQACRSRGLAAMPKPSSGCSVTKRGPADEAVEWRWGFGFLALAGAFAARRAGRRIS